MSESEPKLTEREIELINLLVDGAATRQERAEAESLLSRSEEARSFHESILEVAESLDAVPLAPGPDVKGRVMAGLRSGSQPADFSAARSRRRLVLGVSWAVAAALVVGLAVDRWFEDGEGIAPLQAAASMSPAERETWPLLNETEAEGATLLIRARGSRYALEVIPHRPGRVTIRWDAEKLSGNGEASFLFDTASPAVIVHRRSGATGSARVTVWLEGEPVLQSSVSVNR